jgi:hypothetical protein
MLPGAEQDQAGAGRVLEHEQARAVEGAADQHALPVEERRLQGQGRVPRQRGGVGTQGVDVDPSPCLWSGHDDAEGGGAVGGSVLQRSHRDGIGRIDPVGDHVDPSAAGEACGVGGGVVEPEAGGAGLARRGGEPAQHHGLALDAAPGDRPDDGAVPGDRHRGPDATGSAGAHARDRHRCDGHAGPEQRDQIER